MMSELRLLAEGYARPDRDGGYRAAPAMALITDSGKRVLVDPGTGEIRLREALGRAGLVPADIDLVFITHYHPDHWLNLCFFPGVTVCDGRCLYQGDRETPFTGFIPGSRIEVLATPGHCEEHASLLVHTALGRYVVAGDVFWWEDGQEPALTVTALLGLVDPFADDRHGLVKSRLCLLEVADFIIPGHGRMFQTPAVPPGLSDIRPV
jgi:glyoxylase-like metal-dependent hydrolase (beta-lactamase superfamily II)